MDLTALQGSIERVTFHSEETGFCVLKVQVQGYKELVTVTGSSSKISPGEYLEFSGHWINDSKYGQQFKAKYLKTIPPSTLEGIEKYLGSGLIKGVGPHFAKLLVDQFGNTVFDVIEKTPEKLRGLPGIGKQRYDQIIESWHSQKIIRNIMVFLQSHGLGIAKAVRIFKTYGADAVEKVRENPYRLALDIHGIGFKTADQLAQRLGIDPNSQIRAEAAVRHVLQEVCSFGHCAIPQEELLEKTHDLLNIDEKIIQEAIVHETALGRLVQEDIQGKPSVFLANLYRAEWGISEHLFRLSRSPIGFYTKEAIEAEIEAVQNKVGIELSSSQQAAIHTLLNNKISIVTGGPGVGKTTLVNSILQIFLRKRTKVLLAAPTGRAAKRLQETTLQEAKTIHRLLEFDPKHYGFKRNAKSPLDVELLIIDETSMMDVYLMHAVLQALPNEARLILVGDVDQLPSVGPGMVLSNLINSCQIPTVKLKEIFRQAQGSLIIQNAHAVNQGRFPKSPPPPSPEGAALSDFYLIAKESPEEIHATVLELVTHRIPNRFGLNPLTEIQVLVPMNRGLLGVRQLNLELQQKINPEMRNKINKYGIDFAEKDKVIQLVNNYDKEVFNGDIGFIQAIDLENQMIVINFDDREVCYDFDDLEDLSLAYATTVHKAQGSEYPAIVMPLSMQHYTLLERNLLYTGMTRGRRLVILVGQMRALAMAINNFKASKRWGNLTQRIIDIYQGSSSKNPFSQIPIQFS
ncbi:MAG: ATP-dependent RecD-like DNA helicase [Gammaproteobacteria bacterium]